MIIHRIVNSLFNSCTYILHHKSSKDCIIIDCGDSQPIIEYTTKNKLNIKAILITHVHFDHIYGLHEVINIFPESYVYTTENGVKNLKEPRYNISRYHNNYPDFIFESNNIIIVHNNEILNIADLNIKVIETPGHDWSCICYVYNNNIFTGDSYIPELKVVSSFPKSNKDLAIQNKEKLMQMEKNGFKVYAGHKI